MDEGLSLGEKLLILFAALFLSAIVWFWISSSGDKFNKCIDDGMAPAVCERLIYGD